MRPLLSSLFAAILCAAASPAASAQPADATGFVYLERDGDALATRHSLAFSFSAAPPMRVFDPTHRSAVFNDVPFEISLSAFITPQAAIMIHAEHVADLSGAANYDRYQISDWPSPAYRSPGSVCHEIPLDVVAEEHDLLWLRARGFEPSGAIWMEQHFLSGNHYNDEIVISVIVKGPSCDDVTGAQRRLADAKSRLNVRPR